MQSERQQRKKRDRYRDLEANRRFVQEQNDAARAAVNCGVEKLRAAAEQERVFEDTLRQNRRAVVNRTWMRALRKLAALSSLESEVVEFASARRGASCPASWKYVLPAKSSGSQSLTSDSSGNSANSVGDECSMDTTSDAVSSCSRVSTSCGSMATSSDKFSECSMDTNWDTVSTCSNADSSCDSEAGDAAEDLLPMGQYVLISHSVNAEGLRGRVGVVVKQSKRNLRYTVSVGGHKIKSTRAFLEPAPIGEELRRLTADVLCDWLPATAGWEPHKDCTEQLMLDFIDSVRAVEFGDRPLPPHAKPGKNLAAILENEEEPMESMDSILAGAYLDLPNPLCNPWQRYQLWDFACPDAKRKYRTKLQKLMDTFPEPAPGGSGNNSASSCELGQQNTRCIEDATATTVREEPAAEANCVVCLADSNERSIDWVFKDCGHRCLCKPCVRKLHNKASSGKVECPLCRCVSSIVPLRIYTGSRVYSSST